MISESIIYVMVATMKQIKSIIQEKIGRGAIANSTPIYAPTVMVVKKLASNLYIKEHFKTIVFGMHNKNTHRIERTKLKFLAKIIANRTLWDISQDKIFKREYDEDYCDTNIMTALAGYKYEAKYKIWLNKLEKLIFESNEHWLINQFQYCKTFMFNNSFEADITTIPEYLFKAAPLLSKLRTKNFDEDSSNKVQNLKRKNKNNNWVEQLENSKEVDKRIKNNNKMVKMINISSLIGFFLANENRLKQIFKSFALLKTNNLKTKINFEKTMKRRENQIISRFTSSYFGPIYSTVAKFIDT